MCGALQQRNGAADCSQLVCLTADDTCGNASYSAYRNSNGSSYAQGSGEVSSANYIAREYGVRAGMFMAEAKRRCPDLIVLPYEVSTVVQHPDLQQ